MATTFVDFSQLEIDLLVLSLQAIALFDEKSASSLFEGVKAYVQKVRKNDSDFMLDEILNSVIFRMRFPNAIFDRKYQTGEEDEEQERYLSFREDLAKSLFISLANIKNPQFHSRFLTIINDLI